MLMLWFCERTQRGTAWQRVLAVGEEEGITAATHVAWAPSGAFFVLVLVAQAQCTSWVGRVGLHARDRVAVLPAAS